MEARKPAPSFGSALKFLLVNQLLMVGGALATGLLSGFAIGIWVAANNLDQSQIKVLVAQHRTLISGLGGVAGLLLNVLYLRGAIASRRRHELAESLGFTPTPPGYRRKGLLLGCLMGLGCFATLVALILLGQGPDGQGEMGKLASANPFVWTLMAVGLAPWVEEVLFRGFMFSGFQARCGTRWAAFWVTLIFVLLHWGEMRHFPVIGVFVGCVGITAQLLRIRTGSIGPGYWVHMGYNGTLAGFLWAGWLVTHH